MKTHRICRNCESELKREFVKGFYEKLYPLIQEDMFVKAEREEKRAKQLSLFGEQ